MSDADLPDAEKTQGATSYGGKVRWHVIVTLHTRDALVPTGEHWLTRWKAYPGFCRLGSLIHDPRTGTTYEVLKMDFDWERRIWIARLVPAIQEETC